MKKFILILLCCFAILSINAATAHQTSELSLAKSVETSEITTNLFDENKKKQATLLSAAKAQQVFKFVFGEELDSVTEEDRKKAKKILKSMIKQSCGMHHTKKLMESSLFQRSDWRPIVKKMVVQVAKGCNGVIYENVKVSLKRNWRSAFEIRKQTGEW